MLMYVNGGWAVAYEEATNLHTLIFMSATANTTMGSGFQRNTVSKLKHRWGTQTQKQLNKNHKSLEINLVYERGMRYPVKISTDWLYFSYLVI